MSLSSIDHSSDSGDDSDNDGDELIPVAVPVAAVIARRSHDDVDSEVEGDEEGSGHYAGHHDTTFDATVDQDEETLSLATHMTPPPSSSKKRSNSEMSDDPANSALTASAKKKMYNDGKPRQPAAKGLTIPFRTIKRIMKTDKDIGIIQNDAAIVATAALEQFVKDFATKSLALATRKGRNTIKYDDVAEVRASDRSLSFLDMLLP
mmetsp:Transcript_11778/g.22339  ORF Transcript_11778/g.22339 Transcript_11778/m.22339 type:complete len:206 (-) Transcript_11778:156-773(-)